MASSAENRRVIGTFASGQQADLAAEAARGAGFEVERPEDNRVLVDAGAHRQPVGEAEGILRAYGALEFGSEAVTPPQGETPSDKGETPASRAVRAAAGAKIELVEEEL